MTKEEYIAKKDRECLGKVDFKVGDKAWVYSVDIDTGWFTLHHVTIRKISAMHINSPWVEPFPIVYPKEEMAGVDVDVWFDAFFHTRREAEDAAYAEITRNLEKWIEDLKMNMERHQTVLDRARRRKCRCSPMEYLARRLMFLAKQSSDKRCVWCNIDVYAGGDEEKTIEDVTRRLERLCGRDGTEWSVEDEE